MTSSTPATLTEGEVGLALRKLAIPMAVGIVFIIPVNLVDTYFVGQLGTAELAAMSFTFPVVTLVMSLAMGLGIGATSAVSRALGGGDAPAVKRLTVGALVLAVLVVSVISGVGVLTQRQVFTWLGATPDLLPLLDAYMTIWYAGAVFLVVPMVANGVMRAMGDARTPALMMMVAAVANLVLDPLLIFGWGPVPALGLRGAAIATVLARSVTLVFALYLVTFRLRLLDRTVLGPRPLWRSWRQIVSVGAPAALTNALVPLATAVMTAIVANYGNAAVAGFGIGGRVEGLLLIVPMAVASALTPFIGQNWGAQQASRVAEALQLANRTVMLWGIAVWGTLMLAAEEVAQLFTDDPQVVASARMFLWLVPLGYGAHGLVSVASATFNAVDRALQSTALSATRSLVLAVPLALVGGQLAALPGVFAGLTAATMISGALAFGWLRALARPVVLHADEVWALERNSHPSYDRLASIGNTVDTALDVLLDHVQNLDDITVRARPVNTLGFYVGPFELGHVHRQGHLDLHFPPAVHDQLIAEGHAEHHRHIADASWISVRVHDRTSAEKAAWLLALGQALGRLRRDPVAGKAHLDALKPSAELGRRVVEAAARCRRALEKQVRRAAG